MYCKPIRIIITPVAMRTNHSASVSFLNRLTIRSIPKTSAADAAQQAKEKKMPGSSIKPISTSCSLVFDIACAGKFLH